MSNYTIPLMFVIVIALAQYTAATAQGYEAVAVEVVQ